MKTDQSRTKTISAEAHVLDRLLYLLEETSVNRLIEQDKHFAVFVDNLYDAITVKASQLQKV